ncbi:multicopper oxidase domain-containing protein [Devosia sp.]|uniref:multicopper oxidase family protein n=1 Tax=Devosia sp. TaxID=1871048 RepID=UPI003264CC4D
MNMSMSRRAFMASAAALGAASVILPASARAASEKRLIVGKRTIEVNGKPASVFGLTGPNGDPSVVLAADEMFDLTLENRSGVATIIHWHGQLPPPELDGVTDTGYAVPLEDGETRPYRFAARPGTHWMHSHQGLQEQQLLAAPLIVRTAADLKSDLQEVVVLLHDFSFRDPVEILNGLTGGSTMGQESDAGGMGMAMPMDMSGMAMPMTPSKKAQSPMIMGGMDLNDIEFDAYLANDRTLDDPLVVRTDRNGRVRLRIINGATSTAFWIDLGGALATLVAVDGNDVVPISASRFSLAQAQRIDLIVDVGAGEVVPVLAQREGDRPRTGIILAAPGVQVNKLSGVADTASAALNLDQEAGLMASVPLSTRSADVRHAVMLTGSMMPYQWSMDDQTWATHRKLEVSKGQRVEIEFMNHSMMAHPMHLHGHHFQIVEIAGRRIAGAIRDTVLVPPMTSVVVAFDADNPGRWLYHCHNLYHMATGMMAELIYL